jgi:hypothetical protein
MAPRIGGRDGIEMSEIHAGIGKINGRRARLPDRRARWHRVFANRNGADPRDLLRKASVDLWKTLEVSGTVHPESKDIARQVVVATLGITGPELNRLSGAVQFMELHREPRGCALWGRRTKPSPRGQLGAVAATLIDGEKASRPAKNRLPVRFPGMADALAGDTP